MSQPNEPPLALDSWHITVKLNDGTDFKIKQSDIEEWDEIVEIQKVVDEHVAVHIDHLRGKYGH
jgi:hypothetical protein